MIRRIIPFVILVMGFSFIGCTSNTEKLPTIIEMDEVQCSEIEKKIGLEKITETNMKSLFTEETSFPEKYKEKRAKKIKSEEITREGIDEVVARAKFLVEKYYYDELKEVNYIRLDIINAIDGLGVHLSEALAFELLEKCVEYYEASNLEQKIQENDESIYWYYYTTNLLYDYYSSLKEIDNSNDEVDIISSYLISAKEYIAVKALNISDVYDGMLKKEMPNPYLRILVKRTVLKKDLQRAKETFVERRESIKLVLDEYKENIKID